MCTQQAGKLEIAFKYLSCTAFDMKQKIINKTAVINHRDPMKRFNDAPPDNIFEDINKIFATILTATITETNKLMYVIGVATVILEMLGIKSRIIVEFGKGFWKTGSNHYKKKLAS
ncbi:unnamed protein product [Dracunculus medinensis]|uniref:GLOBIN domain-containing protein n=1 Tax=Dracunculus medinensis TaxID=318479 RepID=A0A0N4UBX7_DRAME|nr:unnamed protein product [Dracunculus medinensis]